MSEIEVTEVLAFPNDVLKVTGTVGGNLVEAYGWQSALTNHYPAEAYDRDGNLNLKPHGDAKLKQPEHKGAETAGDGDPVHKPREMSKAEKVAYCHSLLEAAVESRPKSLKL